MAKAFTVTAVWDPDAEVFTTKSDIPGLGDGQKQLNRVLDCTDFGCLRDSCL
jgi:hypothetical protein